MKISFAILAALFFISFHSYSQHIGMSFQEVKKKNMRIEDIERNYKRAIGTPPAESVFSAGELQPAYQKFLQDLGAFLAKNNFKWEKKTKCFQRIYFNNDGSIDYFIFNFTGKPESQPSAAQQAEFSRLVNLFVQDYKFSLSAKVKFSHCRPATYTPQ